MTPPLSPASPSTSPLRFLSRASDGGEYLIVEPSLSFQRVADGVRFVFFSQLRQICAKLIQLLQQRSVGLGRTVSQRREQYVISQAHVPLRREGVELTLLLPGQTETQRFASVSFIGSDRYSLPFFRNSVPVCCRDSVTGTLLSVLPRLSALRGNVT